MATEMKETEMKVTTKTTTKKRFQKNCIESTRSHRRCVFELTDDVQCARCVKFHLTCVFRLSGMIHLSILLFSNSFSLAYQKMSSPPLL